MEQAQEATQDTAERESIPSPDAPAEFSKPEPEAGEPAAPLQKARKRKKPTLHVAAEDEYVALEAPSAEPTPELARAESEVLAEAPEVLAPELAGQGQAEPAEQATHAEDAELSDLPPRPAEAPAEISPEDDEIGDDQPVETDPQAQQELAEQEITTEQVVEALLFASENPLSLQKIVSLLGVGSTRDVRKHIEAINKRYERMKAAFRVEKIAGGYQMLTLPAFNTWLRRVKQSRQESRFSPAALETLAVVAYKQPVVRAEIEAIRGVSAGEMLNRLRELGLVKIVGRAEDVGRPMLYGTTKKFLEVFGLSGLEDLPAVEQLQPPE